MKIGVAPLLGGLLIGGIAGSLLGSRPTQPTPLPVYYAGGQRVPPPQQPLPPQQQPRVVPVNGGDARAYGGFFPVAEPPNQYHHQHQHQHIRPVRIEDVERARTAVSESADVNSYLFAEQPELSEVVVFPRKIIYPNLSEGAYQFVRYDLYPGSKVLIDWHFVRYNMAPSFVILRGEEAFDRFKLGEYVSSSDRLYESNTARGDYTFYTPLRGEYYFVFYSQVSRTSQISGRPSYLVLEAPLRGDSFRVAVSTHGRWSSYTKLVTIVSGVLGGIALSWLTFTGLIWCCCGGAEWGFRRRWRDGYVAVGSSGIENGVGAQLPANGPVPVPGAPLQQGPQRVYAPPPGPPPPPLASAPPIVVGGNGNGNGGDPNLQPPPPYTPFSNLNGE
ncbi:hypothetical protein HDU76_013047 [Blyttiomyces sp. JEL0837]|nr:hypothetical protein HDU76_013047 [Blyttiomyces sp. JEL0837]